MHVSTFWKVHLFSASSQRSLQAVVLFTNRFLYLNRTSLAAIGLNSWASSAGNKESAHIAADIAMLENEVNAVIEVLRANNLEVVALHNHMFGENPRIIFLHYYGRGPAHTYKRIQGSIGRTWENYKKFTFDPLRQ